MNFREATVMALESSRWVARGLGVPSGLIVACAFFALSLAINIASATSYQGVRERQLVLEKRIVAAQAAKVKLDSELEVRSSPKVLTELAKSYAMVPTGAKNVWRIP